MASISNESNGHKTIQFFGPDRKRRSIRLGKCSKRHADAVKVKVEQLLSAGMSQHALDSETAQWVANLNEELSEKLAKVGLIQRRRSQQLAAFLDRYIEQRIDLKPRTIKKLHTTRDHLVKFFGSDKNLRSITAGDAESWRLFLLAKPGIQEENTLRKHAQIAKQFFHAAVREQIIDSNPFEGLRSTVRPNPKRFFFVDRAMTTQLLESIPSAEWRLIIALCRYGGLRCPSELATLEWSDILWDRNRFWVASCKTEHHAGGDARIVPLFPELRPYLEEAYARAPQNAVHVVQKRLHGDSNLRTPLLRFIKRAGLAPWPKLFQNLRSSRQTELEEHYPSHVVCSWMGNSESVAQQHYLQVTDDHYSRAAVSETALQNPVQQPAVRPRKASQGVFSVRPEDDALQAVATICENTQFRQVAVEGLEPPTRGL